MGVGKPNMNAMWQTCVTPRSVHVMPRSFYINNEFIYLFTVVYTHKKIGQLIKPLTL